MVVESELARLIEEQRADDRDFQAPERGVVHGISLTLPSGDGALIDHFEEITVPQKACPIHGLSGLKLRENGTTWCTPCAREESARKRRAKGVPTYDPEIQEPDGRFKATGPRCDHDPSRFTMRGGHLRCRDCLNAASRAHYYRHLERMRAKNRAYKRKGRVRKDGE